MLHGALPATAASDLERQARRSHRQFCHSPRLAAKNLSASTGNECFPHRGARVAYHRRMVLAETVMTLWRSTGNVLAPIYFDLSVEDVPDRCIITVGTAAGNCDRCWCQLNNLQSDMLLTTMSHCRRHEAAVVQWCHMPGIAPGSCKFNGVKIRCKFSRVGTKREPWSYNPINFQTWPR